MVNPAPYRMPKVYIGTNDAFVEYYYYDINQKKYVRDKERLGIRGLSSEDKKRLLNEMCSEMRKLFIERNRNCIYHIIKEVKPFAHIDTIPKALQFIRDAKDEDISSDRDKVLRETANKLSKFYELNHLFETVHISRIDDAYLKAFRRWCKDEEDMTGKSINKFLGALQFATEWLTRGSYIPSSYSTLHLRVEAPQNESERFPPLTHEEKVRAFGYFYEVDPGFHLFMYLLYYTSIRGSEIYRIQRKDIDFERRSIYTPYYNTKNGNSNHVQIFDPLYDRFIELGIDSLPGDRYILGNRFLPSQTMYKGPQASNKWYNHRENMDMPKEKQVYGLKHTFNIDYVENNKYNIDWEFLRRHNRHATVQQTQQYISKMSAFYLDETQSIILNYNL